MKKRPGKDDHWQKSLRSRIAARKLEFTTEDDSGDYLESEITIEVTDQQCGIVELKIGENLYVSVEKELLFRALDNYETDHR